MPYERILITACISLLVNFTVSVAQVTSQMLPLMIDPSVFPRIPKGSMDSLMPAQQYQGRISLPVEVTVSVGPVLGPYLRP